MKKLSFTLLILTAFCANIFALGSVTFTLVTTPCDTNGVLVAHYTGGSSPYTIEWYGGLATGYGTTHTGVTMLTDTLHFYTGAPVYVYVSDGSGTIDTGSYAGAAPFTFSFDPVAPFCGAIGTASVTVTGGTSPYTYQWIDLSTSSVASTSNPAMLSAGMYGITITDAAGCVYGTFGSYSSVDSLSPTPTFSVLTTTTVASCTNGTATASIATGGSGVAPYTYSWSTGATTATISGLTMGSYNVTVTDATGCVATGYTYVSQTPTITVHTTPTPATCVASDGAAIGFGSGGMSPYTYLWSNGATTAAISGLTAGSYYLTVTDANGCTGSGGAYITASTPISVTYTTTPSSCTSPTGSATLTLAGGTTPYHDTFFTSPLQTGLTASSLAAGTYSFRVVDDVGCIQTGSVAIPPVDVMSYSFSSSPALCTLSTGSLSVAITGGVAPLTYSWSTGATTSSISSQPAGYYNVTVTDANSCVKVCSGYIPDYSPVSVGFITTDASCLYANDGSDEVVAYGGTGPYTYSWSTGGSSATISSIGTGNYWVSVTDASGCYASDYNYVGYNIYDSSCFCVVKGNVYYDIPGTCIKVTGDLDLDHMQMYCSGIGYTWTNTLGDYYFLVPTGTYTLTETVRAFYPLSTCQSNNIPITATAATGCVITENFANSMDTIHSMHLCTWDYDFPVPGNTYYQYVVVSNQGTVTEPNILAGYKTDGQLLGASFVPSGILGLDGTDWYSNGGTGLSLAPGASQTFLVNYSVPTYIPLGTSVVFKDSVSYDTPMSHWLTDYSPWNNVNYFTTTTVSSYDPNFKEVSPKGYGTEGMITWADSNLQYMVHFQNTGTAPAQNIVVIDTLDPNLNWASLQPVYESAPCKITLSPGGVATFTFSNINLPANGYYTALTSNGLFTYDIKLNPGLPIGTHIRNKASIYFDYNAPVVTNTTLNTIGWPLETPATGLTAAADFFTLYPNPTNGSYTLSVQSDAACNAQMNISDITGRILQTKTLSLSQGSQNIAAQANQLSAGIYFVTLNMNGKTQTQKLVVMK